MYLMAERLRRPMRRMFGGKWVSMLAIPPLTPLFLLLVFVALLSHRIDIAKRRKRMKNKDDRFWVESWL
jgi:hypothetical protein